MGDLRTVRGVAGEPSRGALPMAADGGDAVAPMERPALVARCLRSPRLQLVAFTIALLLLWQFVCEVLDVPSYLLPTPSAIAVALWSGIADGILVRSMYITFIEAVAGFLIAATAGIALGTLIAQFSVVERLVYPYIVGLQSLPKVAIAPLIIVWFGYGFSSKIVVSATIALFPILVNVIVGLKSADEDQLDLMRSLNASRWQALRLVQFPAALPFIFAGLDVAAIFSVLGAIVAEFVGSQAGLGNLLLAFNSNLEISSVFACLILLGLMGTGLHAVIRLLCRRMVFWSRDEDLRRL
jgi:NitT/TauT family transport system permease protein